MIMGAGSPRAKALVATLAIILMLPAVAFCEEAATPAGPTVNMTDVPVRDLIHNLAANSGVNVVMSEAVQGKISLTVADQPFESLLGNICKTMNLSWEKTQDGTYLIKAVQPQREEGARAESRTGSPPDPSNLKREIVYLGWWDCNDMAYLFDGMTKARTPGLTGAVAPVFPYGIGPVTELKSPRAEDAESIPGLINSPLAATPGQKSSEKPGVETGGLLEKLYQYQYPQQYQRYGQYPYTATPGVTPGVTAPGTAAGQAAQAREPLQSVVPGAYGPLAPLLPEGLYAPPIAFLPLNALIVMGDEESVREFRELISQLDVKVRQVQIEVQLVSVSLQEVQTWGLDWQFVGGNTTVETLGMASAGGTIAIGYSRENLVANLQAAVTQSKARVIQAFSVTAINNFPASIFTSFSFPFILSTGLTQPGALGGVAQTLQFSQVQYLTIPTQFTVTPRINADDTVTAFLTPVFTTIGPSVDIPGGGGSIPQVTAQTANSLVRVKNGETFVMGGSLVKNWTKSLRKIPLLSDLPIIGKILFTSTNISQSDDEVFFFVTPRIQSEETAGAPTAAAIP